MRFSIAFSFLMALCITGNPLPEHDIVVAPREDPMPTTLAAPASTTTSSRIPIRPQPLIDGSPSSGGVTLLTTINKWRDKYNVPRLTWSNQLAANAQKTGNDAGGVHLRHQLNPGTWAQVMCPGQKNPATNYLPDTPFELSYVAWLCEVQSPQLLNDNGINQCQLVSDHLHITYSAGQRGHHDILISTRYSSIGCAFAVNPAVSTTSTYQGLWVCDLGF